MNECLTGFSLSIDLSKMEEQSNTSTLHVVEVPSDKPGFQKQHDIGEIAQLRCVKSSRLEDSWAGAYRLLLRS